ncbi:MAG: ArsR/SmtB family transcription factor [Nocardioidaceae bacterium]
MTAHSDVIDACAVRCLHPETVAVVRQALLDVEQMELVTRLFGLLAEPSRARILQALSLVDELCVCDLAASLGMSESAVSHQLRLLRTSRLVTRQRVGRVAYYSLCDEHVRHLLRDGIRHAVEEPTLREGPA